MLHLLRSAVNPKLGLQESLQNWPSISMQLREPPRRRTLRFEELEELLT